MQDGLLTKTSLKEEPEEKEERMTWGSEIEYYLSTLGYSVGFGSLWRFPYVVYANGGGAFLIPYTIFFFILAYPLFYLESALGQMYRKGAPGCLEKAGKRFRGVGISQVVISFFLGAYYNILMAYSLIFLWDSLSWKLPWEVEQDPNSPSDQKWDSDYFYKDVLQSTDSIADLGGINYTVLAASIVSFLVVYLCCVKGIKTSGKVVYVSAPLPYFLLLVLLVRGLYLSGSWDGIKYLFEVDWSKLWGIEIWYRAANQVLFQFSVATACLHNLSSYKEKHNSIRQASLIIPGVTALTGILCAFTVFAYMGHMAKITNVSMEDLPLSGPDLVFIAYPAALTLMPGSTIWSIIFFVMLYFLGIDTEFTFLETVAGYFEDKQGRIFGRKIKLEIIRLYIVVGFFIAGIFLNTKAGFYFLTLYDDYATIVPFLLAAALECLIYGWIKGTAKLNNMLIYHTGEGFPEYARINIKFFTLPILLLLLVASFIQVIIINLFTFPWWCVLLGLCLTGIPVGIVIYFYVRYRNYEEDSLEGSIKSIELTPCHSV